MNSLSQKEPAILGGTACFPQGPPEWPFPDKAVNQVLQEAQQSGIWGKYHGPYLEQLQQELATLHQREQVILCSSGTVAVELALRGLGIGKGDEVILAAYDFEGNFKNILAVGATPMLIDVDSNNCNLDLNLLEQAITKSTKCILVSHLHGGMVPMQALKEFSRKKGIPIIEDACQVPGINIEGRTAGSWGQIGILSFGGSKLLTAGRGGALITSSPQIAQRVKLYSFRGNEAYPLTELQAGLLIPQLQTLQQHHQKRQTNVAYLLQQLGEHSGLTSLTNTNYTNDTSSCPGYYKLGFKYVAEHFAGLSRELFCDSMQAEGIALYPGFRALHTIHSSKRFKQVNQLPMATLCDQNLVVLHHPILLTDEKNMKTIVQAVSHIHDHAKEIIHMYTNNPHKLKHKKSNDYSME
ncbi:aminotransferase class I/II-fold pyridoxal phosphate-dependent enzyme [uncultured Gimesia sp.]|uniref:aminotransferase class I/II-fold pyridoxal phosphate-dependent enzyme n=1 Tax=uncultured Gimesia sp. TaxID=1678688 RepID=UPI002606ED0B|nr:aminotransferase class I/II-fold pyridoxal phosphate-dependent enzyme [uncultured Gimesia sp.]